jgi:hypothetical protein
MLEEKSFMFCGKCGKKIIERKSNGVFYFVFGRKKDKDGTLLPFSPVEMFINGSIKMKCISRTCGHWNIFNYFANVESIQSGQSEPIQSNVERKEVI